MGHHCCTKQKVKRGLWSPEEDKKLVNYITAHGHACWSSVPKEAGLQRCGKSCRLRWINYLKPDLRRGSFSAEEERIIIDVHRILGNRWAQIAKHLPGRTDNEVKNFWNSCVKKKLIAQGLDPKTHNLMLASRSSSATSNRVISNSDELSQFHYSQSNSATTTPFTISSTAKNTKTKDKMKNSADFVPSNLMSSLPHEAMPPASDFQSQDALMSFSDQNSGAAAIRFADGSSSSLGHTNLSGFIIEDCIWDNGGIDPLETLKQTEDGAQRSLCEMEFAGGNGNFELDQMMEFCDGNSMDQLQWDC